jgi:hypothetical protein
MLHAVIRNQEEGLHFLAEVNAYNLKTLEQHTREMARSGEAVRLDIEVDSADRDYFARRGQNWMIRLGNLAGVSINVSPLSSPTSPGM